MFDIDMNHLSNAVGAMGITTSDIKPFTLASIGTVLLNEFECENEYESESDCSRSATATPAFIPSGMGPPSPMSTSSSLDSELVTPHGSPSQGLYLTRPPSSLESLLLGPAHRNPAADHSAQSHNHNAHGHGYHAHRYSDKSYDTHIPKPPQTALGGGALCALLGARMWLPASEMCSIVERPGCAFAGREFLARLEAEIEQFGPEMWRFSGMPGREFLRARINVDGDAITRYQHLSKPAVRTGRELANGPLAGAAYLHVAPPYASSDLLRLVAELEEAGSWRPKIVFEPMPSSCHPGEKEAFERVAQYVDVLSPNHEELMALYGAPLPTAPSELRAAVEKAVQHLLLSVGVGANGAGTVVVRCGAHGACVGTRARGTAWIPAYWAQSSSRVADETGAGNAFLGGFVAGLKLADGNPYDAALYGSVSASFVVEQFGLPTLSAAPGPGAAAYEDMHARVSGPPVAQNFTAARCLRAAARREMWNGDVPQRRLELLRMRVAASA